MTGKTNAKVENLTEKPQELSSEQAEAARGGYGSPRMPLSPQPLPPKDPPPID